MKIRTTFIGVVFLYIFTTNCNKVNNIDKYEIENHIESLYEANSQLESSIRQLDYIGLTAPEKYQRAKRLNSDSTFKVCREITNKLIKIESNQSDLKTQIPIIEENIENLTQGIINITKSIFWEKENASTLKSINKTKNEILHYLNNEKHPEIHNIRMKIEILFNRIFQLIYQFKFKEEVNYGNSFIYIASEKKLQNGHIMLDVIGGQYDSDLTDSYIFFNQKKLSIENGKKQITFNPKSFKNDSIRISIHLRHKLSGLTNINEVYYIKK